MEMYESGYIAKAHGQDKSNFGTIANTDIALLIVSLAACASAVQPSMAYHPLCTSCYHAVHRFVSEIALVFRQHYMY